MRHFQLVQSATELYTSYSGLALVGLAINRHTALKKSLRSIPKRHGIPNIELVRTYIGQLSVGKSVFDATSAITKKASLTPPYRLIIRADNPTVVARAFCLSSKVINCSIPIESAKATWVISSDLEPIFVV